MGYVVYIDIYFILNICIDYLLLRVFGILMKLKKSRWRQIVASLLGGIGAVLKVIKIPIPAICIVFLMMIIAFPRMKKSKIIKMTVYFYILNVIVGGCIFFLQEQGIVMKHIWQLVLFVLVLTLCIEKGAGSFLIQTRFLKNLYSIDLRLGEWKVSGIALLDTGNCLYDPFFHRPVMIGEYREMEKMYEMVEKEKVIWIPYHSLGKEHGLIPAIKVDELIIHNEKETILKENVLVAVAKEKLSVKDQYQFILHGDYMKA